MSEGILVLDAGFEARVKRNEPMSRHTSWHVGGPADVYFSPRDRADLLEFLGDAARRHAALLARPRQQPAGARRRHPRRGHRHAERPHAPRTRQRHHAHLRSRRALRAARAPVHQVGPRARGIPGRYSRHARWRAGDECRRIRRRDLAARAQRRRVRRARRRSPPRRARIHLRLSPHRAAGARRILPGRDAASSNTVPASPKRRCASCSPSARKRNPSANGAAARRSPIPRAITPRVSSKRPASRGFASETSWFHPNTRTSSSTSRPRPPPTWRSSSRTSSASCSEKFGVALTPEFRIAGESL